ncbi:MAG TPA: hypothetical protein VI306_13390 [Pyrinomonadaceae bacterium]
MRKLRNLVCATLLTVVFTASAFAGDMQTPGKTDPPPPPPDGLHFSLPGETGTPGQSDEPNCGTDVLTDLLIEALLTVF